MKKYILAVATVATLGALALSATPAFAQSVSSNGAPNAQHMGWSGRGGTGKMTPPAVFGTVSAINGTTISVTSKTSKNSFTVDASNATVMKNNATSTLGSVAVGDTVVVMGTVSGTNVTATSIRDGVMATRGTRPAGMASSTPAIAGNGEPVVAGKVVSVNGSTLDITNNSNVSYTVDTSNAKIVKGGVSSATISNVAVGDNVVVQGTINGNSVTATSVIDQVSSTNNPQNTKHVGFFGSIGQFFTHLFGF